MKKADKCIHFTGIQHNTCAVGVKYDDVQDKSTSPYSLPCLGSCNPGGATCDKRELPTPEEVEASAAEIKKRFASISKARGAIVVACDGPWKKGMGGQSGTMTCPVCEQHASLDYSRSGYNGHIHATCRTPGCVSWME